MQNLGWRLALLVSALAFVSIVLAACGSRTSTSISPEPISTSSGITDAHTENEDTGDANSEDEDADDHAEVTNETEGAGHAEDEKQHEDMAAMHAIPIEAATRKNPIPLDTESVARGTELFQATCAVCHGETGRGDGVGGAALDPKPADLTANHVQENTDGSLFYTISNGVEGTAMVAWQDQFSEEDRWHLANFIRSLPDTK